jgi:hypothetical protein
MNWPDLISRHFNDWVANPVPSLVALCIGWGLGFFISRMRHQGKIDELEERIKNKTDQIEQKDKAIATASEETNTLKKGLYRITSAIQALCLLPLPRRNPRLTPDKGKNFAPSMSKLPNKLKPRFCMQFRPTATNSSSTLTLGSGNH